MERRCFLAILGTLVCAPLAGGDGSVAANDALRFRWHANVPQGEVIQRSLTFEGRILDAEDDKGIGVGMIFVGLVLVPYLARAVWAVVRDIRYGGLVLDLRGDEVVIKNDPRLDGGVIVLIKPDGQVEFHDESEFPDAAAITSLIEAALK